MFDLLTGQMSPVAQNWSVQVKNHDQELTQA